MDWLPLTQISTLDDIHEESYKSPCIIFKHSTTCPISFAAKMRLDDYSSDTVKAKAYFLDLLQYRAISNAIAEKYSVHHESPQVIVIKDGECIYDESHLDITANSLSEQLPS